MNSPAFFKVKDDPESRKDQFFNQDGFQSGKAKYDASVETEYREMLFRLETEHSNMGLYQIIAQSRPVQMISY